MTVRGTSRPRALLASVALAVPLLAGPAPTPAASLPVGPPRRTLERYLAAIRTERYPAAFALLAAGTKRYFGTAANYASIFRADGLRLERYRIVGAVAAPGGLVATVDETSRYVDVARQSVDEAEGRVLYGVVPEAATYRIKDPYHPWRAVAPAGIGRVVAGLGVTVRKLSFFTGRVDAVVTFENRGAEAVTLLPNRTILRDERGNVLHALIDPSIPYTDREIRRGLRLPANARYTGVIAFASVDRYTPLALALSVGPLLTDGADRPFSIDLPPVPIAP